MCTMASTETTNLNLTIAVDDDRLRAFLRLRVEDDAGQITAQDILEALSAAEVVVNDAVQSRVESFCKQAKAKKAIAKKAKAKKVKDKKVKDNKATAKPPTDK
ncbi:MAG: hypothetical protein V3W34_02070 [Phycisphaerae bacterium]